MNSYNCGQTCYLYDGPKIIACNFHSKLPDGTIYKKLHIIGYIDRVNRWYIFVCLASITVEHRCKEHLIPKHRIRYNHNFVIKELQWNTDITTGCKDRFVITINSL